MDAVRRSKCKVFQEKLEKRWDRGKSWFNLRDCVYYNVFESPKIIWADMSKSPSFVIDDNSYFSLNTTYLINLENENYNLKYLLVLLNSRLLFWLFGHLASNLGEKGLRYFKQFVEQLPIYPATVEQQDPLIKKADTILRLNKELINETDGFKEWLQREPYNIGKFSQKLDKYYKLSFDEFLAELKKKKVDTKSRKTQELLKNEFEESVSVINPLLLQITKTDNEIDQMVYDLYGLTPEEIKIIEDSLDE